MLEQILAGLTSSQENKPASKESGGGLIPLLALLFLLYAGAKLFLGNKKEDA